MSKDVSSDGSVARNRKMKLGQEMSLETHWERFEFRDNTNVLGKWGRNCEDTTESSYF